LFGFLNENRLPLENEFHVFFICPKFATIRREYFYSWYLFWYCTLCDDLAIRFRCSHHSFNIEVGKLWVTRCLQFTSV